MEKLNFTDEVKQDTNAYLKRLRSNRIDTPLTNQKMKSAVANSVWLVWWWTIAKQGLKQFVKNPSNVAKVTAWVWWTVWDMWAWIVNAINRDWDIEHINILWNYVNELRQNWLWRDAIEDLVKNYNAKYSTSFDPIDYLYNDELSSLWEQFKQSWRQFINWMTALPNTIDDTIWYWIDLVVDGAKGAYRWATNGAKNVSKRIVNGAKKMYEWWKNVINNIQNRFTL